MRDVDTHEVNCTCDDVLGQEILALLSLRALHRKRSAAPAVYAPSGIALGVINPHLQNTRELRRIAVWPLICTLRLLLDR